MKIKHLSLQNFGSYKDLELSFESTGLILVNGSTGSGKSTLLDAPVWVLYGVTAKKGSVDNVKSWYSHGKSTIGRIIVDLGSKIINVTRVRGKASENDLYWTFNQLDIRHRGKDLIDSQRILESILGVSKDTFITSSYFNESNRALTFFTDKSVSRREFLQSISDVSLYDWLLNETKKGLTHFSNKIAETEKIISPSLASKIAYENSLNDLTKLSEKFEVNRILAISQYKEANDNFEQERQKRIDKLHKEKIESENKRQVHIHILENELSKLCEHIVERCPTCGRSSVGTNYEKDKAELEFRLTTLRCSTTTHDSMIGLELGKVNNFTELLREKESQENPYSSQILVTRKKIEDLQSSIDIAYTELKEYTNSNNLHSYLEKSILKAKNELFYLNLKNIQDDTNSYLQQYFDSLVKLEFILNVDNSIDVKIIKDENECEYTQLSKGQRGILKLCFASAVMLNTANDSGIHFDLLMFDESLDGFDSEMKYKAVGLFQHLNKTSSSIMVIDHSVELKTAFTDSITVTNNGGISTLE